jgi:hypothetical protein
MDVRIQSTPPSSDIDFQLRRAIRFEDFAECFPLYVESDKNGSSATFNSISEYIEAQNFVRPGSSVSVRR